MSRNSLTSRRATSRRYYPPTMLTVRALGLRLRFEHNPTVPHSHVRCAAGYRPPDVPVLPNGDRSSAGDGDNENLLQIIFDCICSPLTVLGEKNLVSSPGLS